VRRLLAAAFALVLIACSSKPEPVALASGCDGPDGSCARYLRSVDSESAPLERGTVIVPFTGSIRIGEKPEGLTFVTGAMNLETRETDYKLVPVKSMRVDAANNRQLSLEIEGLIADGAAIDLPDGLVKTDKGQSVGALTVKVKTGLSPFMVALADVVWEPQDKSLFQFEGLKPAKHPRDEKSARKELEARLRIRPGMDDEQVGKILEKFDSDEAKKKVPDHRIRGGLMLLHGTSAEYAVEYILSGINRRGVPFEPIRVENLKMYGAFAAVFYDHFGGKLYMAFDTDMAQDTLDMIAVVLAHETIHSSLGGGSATEEVLAMASDTRVYEEMLLFDPAIAQTPSELARSANQLLLVLRNSGRFNFPMAGVLPRPGIDDAARGVTKEPVRSFKDFLFKPDFYGEIPKSAGETGTEVLERYYQKISGAKGNQGQMKFDQHTLKLFDQSIDNGLSPEQILAVSDALKLKPVPLKQPAAPPAQQ
jgi:hypothetical protein